MFISNNLTNTVSCFESCYFPTLLIITIKYIKKKKILHLFDSQMLIQVSLDLSVVLDVLVMVMMLQLGFMVLTLLLLVHHHHMLLIYLIPDSVLLMLLLLSMLILDSWSGAAYGGAAAWSELPISPTVVTLCILCLLKKLLTQPPDALNS